MPNVLTTGTTNGPITTGEVYGTFAETVTANAGFNTSGGVTVLTPTFASATAAQLSDLTRDYDVYFQIGTGGGTVTVAIGPTSTPANTVVSSAVGTAGAVIPVRLPAGWYLKITVATSTIADQIAISC